MYLIPFSIIENFYIHIELHTNLPEYRIVKLDKILS